MGRERTNIRKEILLNEYNSVTAKIEQFLKLQERFLYITIFLGSASLTLLREIQNRDALLFLPIALAGVMSFIMYFYKRNYMLQGYRRYLEGELNKICKKNTIFYSTLAKDKNMLSDINSYFLFVVFGALFTYLMFKAYSDIDLAKGSAYAILVIITVGINLLFLIGAGLFLRSLKKMPEEAHSYSLKMSEVKIKNT